MLTCSPQLRVANLSFLCSARRSRKGALRCQPLQVFQALRFHEAALVIMWCQGHLTLPDSDSSPCLILGNELTFGAVLAVAILCRCPSFLPSSDEVRVLRCYTVPGERSCKRKVSARNARKHAPPGSPRLAGLKPCTQTFDTTYNIDRLAGRAGPGRQASVFGTLFVHVCVCAPVASACQQQKCRALFRRPIYLVSATCCHHLSCVSAFAIGPQVFELSPHACVISMGEVLHVNKGDTKHAADDFSESASVQHHQRSPFSKRHRQLHTQVVLWL